MATGAITAQQVYTGIVAKASRESSLGFFAILSADAAQRTINGVSSAHASRAGCFFQKALLDDEKQGGLGKKQLGLEKPLLEIGNAFLGKAIFGSRRNPGTEPAFQSYIKIAKIAYRRHLAHEPGDGVALNNLALAEEFSGAPCLLDGILQ